MTGSAMREPEMGQRNSFGGCFGLGFKGFEGDEGRDLLKIFHFRLGVAASVVLCFSVSLSNAHLVCMGL